MRKQRDWPRLFLSRPGAGRLESRIDKLVYLHMEKTEVVGRSWTVGYSGGGVLEEERNLVDRIGR
jgi:hypothetical protein